MGQAVLAGIIGFFLEKTLFVSSRTLVSNCSFVEVTGLPRDTHKDYKDKDYKALLTSALISSRHLSLRFSSFSHFTIRQTSGY